MGLSRRQFLKASGSAALTMALGRYQNIEKLLGSPGKILGQTLDGSFNIEHYAAALDYFRAALQIVWNPSRSSAYAIENMMDTFIDKVPFDDFHLSGLSQKTLVDLYQENARHMQTCTIEIFHILKYGDDIPRLSQLIQDNTPTPEQMKDLFEDELSIKTLLAELGDGYATKDNVRQILHHLSHAFQEGSKMLLRHLTPESKQSLAQETLFRIPGTDFDIPYLFDPKHMNGVMEAIGLDYNGVFFDTLGVPDDWRALLRMAGDTEQARATAAKWIIAGDDGYFNLNLADRLNLSVEDFKSGLQKLIESKIDYEPGSQGIDTRDALYYAPFVADELAYISTLIQEQKLAVTCLNTKGDQNLFLIIHTSSGVNPHDDPDMDLVCGTIDQMMPLSVRTLWRFAPTHATVAVLGHGYENMQAIGVLDSLADMTSFAQKFAQYRSAQDSSDTQEFTNMFASARSVWPNIRLSF